MSFFVILTLQKTRGVTPHNRDPSTLTHGFVSDCRHIEHVVYCSNDLLWRGHVSTELRDVAFASVVFVCGEMRLTAIMLETGAMSISAPHVMFTPCTALSSAALVTTI